jgi:hypothetical protein
MYKIRSAAEKRNCQDGGASFGHCAVPNASPGKVGRPLGLYQLRELLALPADACILVLVDKVI